MEKLRSFLKYWKCPTSLINEQMLLFSEEDVRENFSKNANLALEGICKIEAKKTKVLFTGTYGKNFL
jgi:hypothetical protein